MKTNNKDLPLDQFIEFALYDKADGYYMKKNPFGKEGDFITAPEMSQLFGEMIGMWCMSHWMSLGKPKTIDLLELGPGKGTLMKDILSVAKKFPDFHSDTR